MLSHYSTSCFALLFATALHAQPTLTQASNAPVPGLSFSLNYSPITDPGSAGPDATWDFSALAVDSTDLVQWVLPSETPNGPLFPTATVAELWDAISYSEVNATGLYVVGGDEQGTIVTYTDSRQALPWPCTYQTSWDDDYEGAYTVMGLDVTRSGNYTGTADAYGTVQLPWGSVPDVLRIHIVAHQEDATDFGTLYLDIDAYQYFIAGSAWPVVEVTSATASSIAGPLRTSTPCGGRTSTLAHLRPSHAAMRRVSAPTPPRACSTWHGTLPPSVPSASTMPTAAWCGAPPPAPHCMCWM